MTIVSNRPLSKGCFTDSASAWQTISRWHEQGIPYNLLYCADGIYVMPRQIQNQITHQEWTSGFSWIETVGEIVVQNASAFSHLSAGDIEQEMYKLNIDNREPASGQPVT